MMRQPAIIAYELIGRELGIEPTEICSSCRRPEVVFARAVYAHLMRTNSDMSWPEIAATFGRRCHSTPFTATCRLQEVIRGRSKAARAKRAIVEAMVAEHRERIEAWKRERQFEANEVWRARFARVMAELDLHAHSLADLGRLSRFEVEARLREVAA